LTEIGFVSEVVADAVRRVARLGDDVEREGAEPWWGVDQLDLMEWRAGEGQSENRM